MSWVSFVFHPVITYCLHSFETWTQPGHLLRRLPKTSASECASSPAGAGGWLFFDASRFQKFFTTIPRSAIRSGMLYSYPFILQSFILKCLTMTPIPWGRGHKWPLLVCSNLGLIKSFQLLLRILRVSLCCIRTITLELDKSRVFARVHPGSSE